ncbi:uncharacterized protein PAC_15894 [Phialocephala subalpina]|uniref:Uncharacterized protein n=1 Tax=Phialocephala subalpina TaxID=576137 RepID=A0A1L7XLW1_9HELO|nr:uncharacterized protein PAC_15894 [Phialocephala subalpina]
MEDRKPSNHTLDFGSEAEDSSRALAPRDDTAEQQHRISTAEMQLVVAQGNSGEMPDREEEDDGTDGALVLYRGDIALGDRSGNEERGVVPAVLGDVSSSMQPPDSNEPGVRSDYEDVESVVDGTRSGNCTPRAGTPAPGRSAIDSHLPMSPTEGDVVEAVVEASTVLLKLLLETGKVEVDAKDSNGRTPLLEAAHGGHEAIFKLLLETGKVEVDAKDSNGRTALQAAAEGGHLAVVERLLQERADVNAAAVMSGGGRTALQAAAGGGHLAVVERLLQEKADVNAVAAQDSGRTALQAAAEGGHLAVVERLLQEKADVNAVAAEYGGGRTALQAAAEGGYLDIVNLLRHAGAMLALVRTVRDRHPDTLASMSNLV